MNEAGTKGGEHNLVALLEQMLIVPKGQWNGGCTGVAIMVDIDHHAVEIELGTLGYSLNDTVSPARRRSCWLPHSGTRCVPPDRGNADDDRR